MKGKIEMVEDVGPDGRPIWYVQYLGEHVSLLGWSFRRDKAVALAEKERKQRGCRRGPRLAREVRNAAARARSQTLRDLTGTSAKAAREDMGF